MSAHRSSSLTLGDVVQALQDLTDSDDEAIAVLAHMIQTRRVRLTTAASR